MVDEETTPRALDSGEDEPRVGGSTTPENERVAELMAHTIDVPVLAEAVARQQAADAADVLEDIEDEEAVEILGQLDDHAAAEALAEMRGPLAAGVLTELVEEDAAYASRLLELMAPDDAADLLQALDDDERSTLLDLMGAKPRGELVRLAAYDEESAGGMMTTDFLALGEDLSVTDAIEHIRGHELSEETKHALIIDARGRLVGILGLRQLLTARAYERVGDICTGSTTAVYPDLDREEVAREFDRYDFDMLPVIDRSGRLLGIVTVDDVIDIIRDEQTEDVQKTVGAGKGEAVYSSLLEKLRGRFRWLLISLVMTCVAAAVIFPAEALIKEQTILAFLLPVLAALVGNAGHQALAVTLRGIVLDEVRRDRVWPLVLREGAVGLTMGAALGIIMCLIVGTLSQFTSLASWRIGAVAGLAAAASMGVGTLAGAGVPLIMRRLGWDPAQSSAIFLIMITDGISFSVLLGLTALLTF
jgi:magnesium transporter